MNDNLVLPLRGQNGMQSKFHYPGCQLLRIACSQIFWKGEIITSILRSQEKLCRR